MRPFSYYLRLWFVLQGLHEWTNAEAIIDVVVVRPFQPNSIDGGPMLVAECYATDGNGATPQDCCDLVASVLSDNTKTQPCIDALAFLAADIDNETTARLPRYMSIFPGVAYTTSSMVLHTPTGRVLTEPQDISDLQLYGTSYLLESSLTPTGGMHRQLHVTIEMAEESPFTPTCTHVPIYVPSGLFINIEDLFVTTDTTIEVSLVKPVPTIDQEEPSFASKPSAVVVQVCNMQKEHSASFGMHWHSRYPGPCEEVSKANMVRWSLQDTLLEYDVACPHGQDYHTIVMLSVAASLVGAFVSLHSVASISQWM